MGDRPRQLPVASARDPGGTEGDKTPQRHPTRDSGKLDAGEDSSSSGDSVYDYDYRGQPVNYSSSDGESDYEPLPTPNLRQSLRLSLFGDIPVMSASKRRRAAGIFILGAPGSGKHVLQSLFERLATKYNLNVVIEAVKPGEAVEDLSPSDVVLLLYDVASAVALSTLPAAAMADGFNHRKTVLVGNKIDLEYYRRVSSEDAFHLCSTRQWYYAEVSALGGLHVKDLFFRSCQLLDPEVGGILQRAAVAEMAASKAPPLSHSPPALSDTGTLASLNMSGTLSMSGKLPPTPLLTPTSGPTPRTPSRNGRFFAASWPEVGGAVVRLKAGPGESASDGPSPPLAAAADGHGHQGEEGRRSSRLAFSGMTICDLGPAGAGHRVSKDLGAHRPSKDLVGLGAMGVLAAMEGRGAMAIHPSAQALLCGGEKGGCAQGEERSGSPHKHRHHGEGEGRRASGVKEGRRASGVNKRKASVDGVSMAVTPAVTPVVAPPLGLFPPPPPVVMPEEGEWAMAGGLDDSGPNPFVDGLSVPATFDELRPGPMAMEMAGMIDIKCKPMAPPRVEPTSTAVSHPFRKDKAAAIQREIDMIKAEVTEELERSAGPIRAGRGRVSDAKKADDTRGGDTDARQAVQFKIAGQGKSARSGVVGRLARTFAVIGSARLSAGSSREVEQPALPPLAEGMIGDVEAVLQALAGAWDRALNPSTKPVTPFQHLRARLLLPLTALVCQLLTLTVLVLVLLPALLTVALFRPTLSDPPTDGVETARGRFHRWARLLAWSAPVGLLLNAAPFFLSLVVLPLVPSSEDAKGLMVAYVSALLALLVGLTLRSFRVWRGAEITIPGPPDKLTDAIKDQSDAPSATHTAGPRGHAKSESGAVNWLASLLPGKKRDRELAVAATQAESPTNHTGGPGKATAATDVDVYGSLKLVPPRPPPGSFTWGRRENVVLLACLGVEFVHMVSLPLKHHTDAITPSSVAWATAAWPQRLFLCAYLNLSPPLDTAVSWGAVGLVGCLLCVLTHACVPELRRYGAALHGNPDKARDAIDHGLTGTLLYGREGLCHVSSGHRIILALIGDALFLPLVLRLLDVIASHATDPQGSSGRWQSCVCLWVLGHYLHLSVAVAPRLLQGTSGTSAPGQPPREATFTPPYLMTVCLLKAVLLLICAFEGPTGVDVMLNLPVGLVACGAVSSSLGLLTLLWVTDVTPRHYAEDLQPCSVGLVSLAKGGAYVACLLTSLLLLAARAMGTPQGFHAMALYPALLLSWGAVIAAFVMLYGYWHRGTQWWRVLVSQLLQLPHDVADAAPINADKVVTDADFRPLLVPGYACCQWCALQQVYEPAEGVEEPLARARQRSVSASQRPKAAEGEKEEMHMRRLKGPWRVEEMEMLSLTGERRL